ncbi:MAG: F0F1 ATP synthase subunit A [Clostridiales bacterium]|nr:F0F1 ATP synthase subunit A [Clostridiales bacterium]
MNLGEELIKSISSHTLFEIKVFGLIIPVSDSVVMTWMVMLIMVVASVLLTRNFKLIPSGVQNFVESIVEFINNFARQNIGYHWKTFAPFVGTMFLFLIISNTISIFSIIPSGEELYRLTGWAFFERLPEFKIRPPTRDLNIPLGMAVLTVITVTVAGIKVKGVKGWLHSFFEPVGFIFPLKIAENFIRIMSLSFRLFGNVLGAFIIMEILYAIMPAALPAAFSLYFDLFDGVLQAYIFVFLTTLYIAEAVE